MQGDPQQPGNPGGQAISGSPAGQAISGNGHAPSSAARIDDAATQSNEVNGSAVPARPGKAWAWGVVVCYLAGAVAVTSQLWLDPVGRAQAGSTGAISPDIGLFAWFMRYAATAVAHGHLPALVTTAVNAPQGINLMWNTSFLLPAVVLSPVTLLAGPYVSLTITLTLGFAGSASAMFLALRRWGAQPGAAALGGALYGFSPALRMAAIGHYHLQFAVLPPLIIDLLLRIVTGRDRRLRTCAWLGLLAAAQFLTSEELLVITVVAAAVILLVLAASRPRAVPGRLRTAAGGLAAAAGIALVICAYPLWVQFHGPLASHGSPWPPSQFWNRPGDFVAAPSGMLWHSVAATYGRAAKPEYLAYLGWPLLLLLVLAAVWCWRDMRVRVMAITFALLEFFSLGTQTAVFPGFRYPAPLLPWHWLAHLPLLNDVLVNRFSIVADGAAAAVVAFAVQFMFGAAPETRRWWRPAVAAVAALTLIPLIPLPFHAGQVSPVPSGWQRALTDLRLPSMARVLVIPAVLSTAMNWQAQTGAPISIIGGYCIAPDPSRQAKPCRAIRKGTAAYLNSSPAGRLPAGPDAKLTADLAYWRPAAVVAVAAPGSRLAQFLSRLFGRPTVRVGDVVVWRRSGGT